MEPTIAQIRELLGVLVFGEEDDELENAVVRLLNEPASALARLLNAKAQKKKPAEAAT